MALLQPRFEWIEHKFRRPFFISLGESLHKEQERGSMAVPVP